LGTFRWKGKGREEKGEGNVRESRLENGVMYRKGKVHGERGSKRESHPCMASIAPHKIPGPPLIT